MQPSCTSNKHPHHETKGNISSSSRRPCFSSSQLKTPSPRQVPAQNLQLAFGNTQSRSDCFPLACSSPAFLPLTTAPSPLLLMCSPSAAASLQQATSKVDTTRMWPRCRWKSSTATSFATSQMTRSSSLSPRPGSCFRQGHTRRLSRLSPLGKRPKHMLTYLTSTGVRPAGVAASEAGIF